jgi:hypothetical protein
VIACLVICLLRIALPRTQRCLAERGLTLIAPPEKCVIARGGGWCLAAVRASTVELSSRFEWPEHLLTVVWLR